MVATLTPNSPLTQGRDRTRQPLKPSPKGNGKLLAILAVIALIAVGLFRVTHGAPKTITYKVVASARDLPAGVRLSYTMLKFMEVPKEFATKDMTGSLNDVVERETRTFIPAGEPIRSNMVFHSTNGLAPNLFADERAITLQLDDDEMLDHTVRPDDRVDILVVSSSENKKYTKTICQSARVLIASNKAQGLAHRGSNAGANKITLAVAPFMTERLAEAAEVGKIRLVLRNPHAGAGEGLIGSEPADLLPAIALRPSITQSVATVSTQGVPANLPAPPPAPDAVSSLSQLGQALGDTVAAPIEWAVQVISGSHKETVSVPSR